jgi:hypothetical protein
MNTRKLWLSVLLLASLAFLLQLSTGARAQDDADQVQAQDQVQNQPQDQPQDQQQDQQQDQPQDQAQDPPGRVGRLNYSQGSISFRPAGEDDWVTAVPNRPIVSGDDLWADENSRAEVHVGSTAVRLGPKTGITFLTVDDRTTQIRLAQGSLIVRVRHVDDDDSYEVDTPNVAFTLLQPGEYRIDVSEDGTRTVTTVWHGRGRVTGGGFTYTVVADQSATFTGDEQHLDYNLGQIPRSDKFDEWAFDRDEGEDRADSANYVSRETTGYEDLDEYGDWNYVAGYGPCWRPRAVAVGWAPYRFGHWVYVGPWGWTWVEDEPWGFAPFHYGRWAFVSGGWWWVPGPVVVRPVWAPAMVAFVGGGPGFGFSVGVGVGWFPLAPGEVYVPGYHVSRAYVDNVNITNTTVNTTRVTNVYNTVIVNRNTTINNVTYANQRVRNAVTVVPRDVFVNARPVAKSMLRVDPKEVERAPVTRGVAAEPVRASVIGAGRPVNVRPPAAVVRRTVVAVRTPQAPPRSIEQRQAQVGGHLNEQVLVRPAGPARPAPGSQGERSQDGFRPFTQPNNNQMRPAPRNQEQRGNAEEGNRNAAQPNRTFEPPQNREQGQREPGQPQMRRSPEEAHPLVRPTPPVQQRSPQHEQQQEQKFNEWRQRRPSPPPSQQRAPESRPQPQRQERPPKKGQ